MIKNMDPIRLDDLVGSKSVDLIGGLYVRRILLPVLEIKWDALDYRNFFESFIIKKYQPK